MLHELREKKRLFAVIDKIKQFSLDKDWVLKVFILKISKNLNVIELPAISDRKLYMLSVSDEKSYEFNEKNLLWIDWEIQFL